MQEWKNVVFCKNHYTQLVDCSMLTSKMLDTGLPYLEFLLVATLTAAVGEIIR
jgi:hypothetical protein